MKHRKILSWTLLSVLSVSLFTGMAPVAAEMTPAEEADYYSYTIGNFVSGYEGYAYEKKADFASLEELQAFPPIANGSGNKWDGISVVDGKPIMSKENDVIDFLFPDYDNKEIAKPTKQKSYALLRYSLSSQETTNFQSSPGQTTRHQNGKMDINQKGTSGAVWTNVTEDIANFAANDILTIKTFQDATRQNSAKLLEYTLWINNETQNTGFVKQLENVNPQSSASNQNIKNYNVKVLAGNQGTVTIYEWASYDQYEYLLRETVRSVETELLGTNSSLQNVTRDLNLPQNLALSLDKDHTGSVTWSSTNEVVVNPQTGVVTRSDTGDMQVTLTAEYTVSGEEGEQTKTIAYPITVPSSADMTPEEAAYYRYTIGKFVSGYEGYAYENDLNFASLEELQTAENIAVDSLSTITVANGKPIFNTGTGKITFQYPNLDTKGNTRPQNSKMYSVVEYSRSSTGTYINLSNGTNIKTPSNGTTIGYSKTGSDDSNWPVSSEFTNVADNQRMRVKFYQDATRSRVNAPLFTTWLENRDMNTGYILQRVNDGEEYEPRWSRTANTLDSIVVQTANYSGGYGTVYAVAAYEQFEYMLRDLVRKTEDGMLQENASLERVETDLQLRSGSFDLDKGCKGTVSWTSSDVTTINPETGEVDRSTTEDKTVTLTATYSVTDGTDTKEKVIVYEIFVPMNASLRKLVDLFTWNEISNTQTADNVRADLYLVDTFSHESVPECTANITWEVLEGADAVTPTGVVTRLPEGDTRVKLKATFSADGLSAGKEFDFVVPRYISPQEETDTIAELLTWETISTEANTAVTKSLTLPTESQTVDENTASITWHVLAGSGAVAADGTVTQQNMDTFASLEAVISCNGAETRKQFDFIILSPNVELTLFDADFTEKGNGTVEESSYAQVMTVETEGALPEGYSAKFVNGTGLWLQTAGENVDTDKLRINWDMRPSAADATILEELKTITTYEITAYVIGKAQANARFALMDNNNRNAVLFTLGSEVIGIQAGNSWNPLGRAPWAEKEIYPTLFHGETGPRMTFRVDYNNITGKLDAYVKLTDYSGPENYGKWYSLALDTTTNDASVQEGLTSLQMESLGTNTVVLERVRCYTTTHALKNATASIVESIDYMNGQNEDFVIGNLEFPQSIKQYGASISWKTEPAGYFDGKGNLISRPAAYETVPVVITPVVTFDNAAWFSATPAFPPETVTIVGVNSDNAALNNKVSVSGVQAAQGNSVDYITDGSLNRGFSSTGLEKRFDVILDMEDSRWNKVRIVEGAPYNVASYEMSVSEDRRNWQTVHTGADLQTRELTLDTDTGYRYLRLSVTEKIMAEEAVHLMEIEVFFEPSNVFCAQEDFAQVMVPTGLVKQNFTVPAIGAVYGSKFTWTSSRTDLVSIAAEPSGDSYLVTIFQPQHNTPVTLTLTAGDVTKTYQITVQGVSYGTGGTSTGSSGGSGGSDSGNRASGSNAGTIPYIPTQANDGKEQQRYFPDVSGWAEKYINTLYEKQIVNGDQLGNFNPDASVSRGEFVKMLTLSLGISPNAAADIPFTDVPVNHWARPYIAAAYRMGIVSGISDTEFGLEQPITRQDLAVLCDRALEKTGRRIQPVEETFSFIDADAIAVYAQESVDNMQRCGIINGLPDGGFHPQDAATRAESAKILCGILPD